MRPRTQGEAASLKTEQAWAAAMWVIDWYQLGEILRFKPLFAENMLETVHTTV